MDKEILEHKEYVTKELKCIDTHHGTARLHQLHTLRQYNLQEIRNFQHERHIHLLVCITFGFIMLGVWLVLFGWIIINCSIYDEVAVVLTALGAVLTILEAAYLRFYYHLENWTQSLYVLDKEIYQSIQAMLK